MFSRELTSIMQTGDSSASGTNQTAVTEQANNRLLSRQLQQTSTESHIPQYQYKEISSVVLFIGQTDEGEQ